MNILYNWYQVSEQLKALKAQELDLRKQVIESFFPELDEGTNKCEIEGGKLVATLPYNYTVDPDAVETALELVPKTKRDSLIVWKPNLSIAVYRKLSKKAMTDFSAECLTIKPGTPSLKIEVPK